jgi:hypothetical protein
MSMQNSNEHQLLVDLILSLRTDDDTCNDLQFEADVHKLLRDAGERGITAHDLLARLDSGISFNSLIELIRGRAFPGVSTV